MMENNNHKYNHYYGKKPKEENFYGGSGSRSQSNKRFSNGRQQQSALSLEKQFCVAVGGVSWEKVLDTQKYMYQDEKVLHWKDSAVQEAFWNAKKRFLAEMYGQPCDIKLPDPDVFIDKIDWDSIIDQQLISDLDKRHHEVPCETQKDSGVVVGIPVIPEQFVLTPMGWGDAEDQGKINGVNDAEKVCSNNGWNDDYVYGTRDMVHHGGSKWNGSHKNKWWNHGGHYKKRSKWWNNGDSYGDSYHNSYESKNRRNYSSDIEWKPKPVSSRQW